MTLNKLLRVCYFGMVNPGHLEFMVYNTNNCKKNETNCGPCMLCPETMTEDFVHELWVSTWLEQDCQVTKRALTGRLQDGVTDPGQRPMSEWPSSKRAGGKDGNMAALTVCMS